MNRGNLSFWLQKENKPLIGLGLLGLIGGVFYEAGDILLRLWGRDVGMSPKDLDLLNMVAILGTLKIFWSPLLNHSFKIFSWGARRTLVAGSMFCSIVLLGLLSYTSFLSIAFLVILALLSITRLSFDMLVVASQVDAVDSSLWGMSESFCLNGYRISMMMIGSGALFLSAYSYSWPWLYRTMSLMMGGMLLVFCTSSLFHFLDKAQPAAHQGYWTALKSFFQKKGSWIILLFMLTYRVQDGMLITKMDLFLMDMGLSKITLGIIKTAALWLGVLSGFVAGIAMRQKGFAWTLYWGLGVHAIMGGCLCLLSFFTQIAYFRPLLIAGFLLENMTSAWTLIAFCAFQLLCCEKKYALTQLALFMVFAHFGFKLFSLRAGWIAYEWGWPALFSSACLANIPIFWILHKSLSTSLVKEAQNSRSNL